MFSLLFVLVNLLVGVLIFYNFHFKRRKLPPGPIPLPLIGNLHSLRRELPEQCFLRWRRQYGDVYTFWIGEVPIVCVAEYAKIMETFQKDGDTYAGRYNHEEMEKILKNSDGIYGVIFTEGELWREQRRFTLQVLRDFGMGKNLMQERVMGELELMFERIDRQIAGGTEVNIAQLLDLAIGSIINNLLFGYRFDDDKLEEFRELKKLLHDMIEAVFHPMTIIFQWHPHLFRRLPFFSGIFEQIIQTNNNVHSFFGRQIQAHMQQSTDLDDLEAVPTDLVEAFLKEKAKREACGEPHQYSLAQLKGLCSDLWIAGQETTSTTLAWGIVFLIHHPEEQAKLHAELDEVIGGTDRLISVADRSTLPRVNAAINEIQRMANLVPINLMHKLTRDVVIDGHHLQKGCAISPQISAVLFNEEIFDHPAEFRSDRFLDGNGKLKRVDELIPFSVGKRQCLGESLARMELFLFLANLLNRYEFGSGEKMPSRERKLGGAIQCPEFTCRIRKRCPILAD